MTPTQIPVPDQGSPSTALLTDKYELTMLQGALRAGTAQRHCVFELFGRKLPASRRYGVVAGTGRLLDAVEAFTFTPAQIDFLRAAQVVDDATLDYLRDYRFSGTIRGYAEGECYFSGSPLLTVEGTFAEACILEPWSGIGICVGVMTDNLAPSGRARSSRPSADTPYP